MATVSLLEKARQRRLNALASRGTAPRSRHEDRLVSIFDDAFDEAAEDTMLASKDNVIAFHSSRNNLVAANETDAPDESVAA